MSIVNGYLSVSSESYGDPTTSSSPYYITCSGDTIRLITKRNISASNTNGLPGEMCIGEDGGTTYLYYCTANNSWIRSPFATW